MDHDIDKFITSLKSFMDNTNKMMADLELKYRNQHLDIDRLKREIKSLKRDKKIILPN